MRSKLEIGDLTCIGSGNSCNKNAQLLAVRRAVGVLVQQGSSPDLQALLDDHCNFAGTGDEVEVGDDESDCLRPEMSEIGDIEQTPGTDLAARYDRESDSTVRRWLCAEQDFRSH